MQTTLSSVNQPLLMIMDDALAHLHLLTAFQNLLVQQIFGGKKIAQKSGGGECFKLIDSFFLQKTPKFGINSLYFCLLRKTLFLISKA